MSSRRLFSSTVALLLFAGAVAGFASAAPLTTVVPTVTLTAQPPASTSATSATISWTSSGATTTTCSTDSTTAVACTSPVTLTGLSLGSHAFSIRVANTAGSNHALASWTITAPSSGSGSTSASPSVTIDASPANPTTATSATFAFSTANATSVTCSLDSAAATACAGSIGYSGLTVGTHAFTVTAASGALSSSAAFSWAVTAALQGSSGANLWVDPNGGTCTRSVSLATYVDASACPSFQAAYQAASLGDRVLVKAGSYGLQVIQRGTAKSGTAGHCNIWRPDASTATSGTTDQCITIQPAAGETVTTGEIWTNATFLRFDGINAVGSLTVVGRSGTRNGPSDTCNSAYGHDIIVQNSVFDGRFVYANGGVFSLIGAVNTSIANSSAGNAIGSATVGQVNHIRDCTGTTTSQYSSNVMLDDVTIHDVVLPTTSTGHAECLHADFPHDHTTIINSRFEDCVQQNISAQSQTVGRNDTTSYFVLENNVFDAPASHAKALGYRAQRIANVVFICTSTGGTFDHLIIRNNSFYNAGGPGGVNYQEDAGACTWTNGIVTGNIFTSVGSCSKAGLVGSNVLLATAGTGCGSDTALGTTTAPYVDAANYDFRLAGSSAYGKVSPAIGYPAFDIDGLARTGMADAGASEH